MVKTYQSLVSCNRTNFLAFHEADKATLTSDYMLKSTSVPLSLCLAICKILVKKLFIFILFSIIVKGLQSHPQFLRKPR